MVVQLGNTNAKETYYEPYQTFGKTPAEIIADALAANVYVEGTEDADGNFTPSTTDHDMHVLIARLSALPRFRTKPGKRITTVSIPAHKRLPEAFQDITATPTGAWAHHSDDPPAWVESDSPGLAALLAEHFGCPIGRPDDWDLAVVSSEEKKP